MKVRVLNLGCGVTTVEDPENNSMSVGSLSDFLGKTPANTDKRDPVPPLYGVERIKPGVSND